MTEDVIARFFHQAKIPRPLIATCLVVRATTSTTRLYCFVIQRRKSNGWKQCLQGVKQLQQQESTRPSSRQCTESKILCRGVYAQSRSSFSSHSSCFSQLTPSITTSASFHHHHPYLVSSPRAASTGWRSWWFVPRTSSTFFISWWGGGIVAFSQIKSLRS